jgi:hypothetical protein
LAIHKWAIKVKGKKATPIIWQSLILVCAGNADLDAEIASKAEKSSRTQSNFANLSA